MGRNGEPGFVTCCAVWGAVVQMNGWLALNHTIESIRVNGACPREIRTDRLDRMLHDQDGDFDENLGSFAAGTVIRCVDIPEKIASCFSLPVTRAA